MSPTFAVGQIVDFNTGHETVRVKVVEIGFADEVIVSDGWNRMPFSSDHTPIYRIGFGPYYDDDDEPDFLDRLDWYRERELKPVNVLEHMVEELNKAHLLSYVEGDATRPQGAGPKVIVHICNNIGAWGAGFVMAISRRWPEPETAYRDWFRKQEGFGLGKIQPIQVEPEIIVINMVAQHGIGQRNGPPIRYHELRQCLQQVTKFAKQFGASVHMPRIGCGLAGGKWENVEEIIHETLLEGGVRVTVYDFVG